MTTSFFLSSHSLFHPFFLQYSLIIAALASFTATCFRILIPSLVDLLLRLDISLDLAATRRSLPVCYQRTHDISSPADLTDAHLTIPFLHLSTQGFQILRNPRRDAAPNTKILTLRHSPLLIRAQTIPLTQGSRTTAVVDSTTPDHLRCGANCLGLRRIGCHGHLHNPSMTGETQVSAASQPSPGPSNTAFRRNILSPCTDLSLLL